MIFYRYIIKLSTRHMEYDENIIILFLVLSPNSLLKVNNNLNGIIFFFLNPYFKIPIFLCLYVFLNNRPLKVLYFSVSSRYKIFVEFITSILWDKSNITFYRKFYVSSRGSSIYCNKVKLFFQS